MTFAYHDQPGALLAVDPAPPGLRLPLEALRGAAAAALASLPQVAGVFFLLLVVSALALLLVRRTHSRQLFVAISLSVILVLLATPSCRRPNGSASTPTWPRRPQRSSRPLVPSTTPSRPTPPINRATPHRRRSAWPCCKATTAPIRTRTG
ncbi:MAG: hypothetical protein HZY76_03460 [Anaerolineae bacterium]|nr:MAG: hypothetical protein HZY76_03460 [Anaerolineae bacterium]